MPRTYSNPLRVVVAPNSLQPSLRLLLGLLCAVWLYTFLPPMERLHALSGASTMFPVFAVLVLVQLVPWRWRWLRVVAGFIAVMGYSIYWYAPAHRPGVALELIWQLNVSQIAALVHHGVFADALQTETFLAAICGMFWLITYAARHPRLWTFYNALSILVLGIIDGNTNVHPNLSIVVQLVLFVAILGVFQFHRFAGQLIYNGRPTMRFFLPLVALLVIAAGVGSVVPKPGPVWADPLAKLDHGTSGKGPGLRQIGYQLDNSQLGGSFILNKTPVLSVVTPASQYLRGAVYSDYTGHGWSSGPVDNQPLVVRKPVLPNASQFDLTGAIQTKPVTAKVTVLSNQLQVPILFAPFEPSVLTADTGAAKDLHVNAGTDVLFGPALTVGQSYTVTSEELTVPDMALADLPALAKNHATDFPAGIQQMYLQLPGKLPASVGQLASQLTSGLGTEYDIVMTIQNYLQANYTYATEGIPVPGKNEDYVNQFLFDSKKGYCNNFSSAMAVLLRTLGIPTRWVTGFAPGTIDSKYTGSGNRYVVTNADAHSWVEVYFPTVGWVPFDPTPNFNMSFAQADAGASTIPATPPVQPQAVPLKPPASIPQPASGSIASSSSLVSRTALWTVAWLAAAVAAIGIGLLIVFRNPIQDWRHTRAWKTDTPEGMQRGILHLLRFLRRLGETKRSEPSLRDLQATAKSYGLEDSEFRQLVRTFERSVYGNHVPTQAELRAARLTWLVWMTNILKRGRRGW